MYTPETRREYVYVCMYTPETRREYVYVCMFTPEINIEENMSMYAYVYSGI